MSTTPETETLYRRPLPPGFLFGVATAAGQIEGGASLGGRTPSIWDVFAGIPGRIADGSSGQVAVDHVHRWPEDLALLADLGVGGYRFSLSWPRVQPHGTGPASPEGLGFYDRLVDALLAAGIEPFVSLFHWDLPLELMEHGGWLIRETAERFADYAAVAAAALGDRVAAWTTVDEPLLHMAYGHAVGIDAPGLTLLGGAFQVTHHQLLAHGRAVQVLRSATDGRIGIVNHHTTVDPASRSRSDIAAAACYHAYHNRQFTDPVLRGNYPDEILAMPGVAEDVISDGDLEVISAPLDFYGVSFYHPTVIAAAHGNVSVPFTLEEMPGGSTLRFRMAGAARVPDSIAGRSHGRVSVAATAVRGGERLCLHRCRESRQRAGHRRRAGRRCRPDRLPGRSSGRRRRCRGRWLRRPRLFLLDVAGLLGMDGWIHPEFRPDTRGPGNPRPSSPRVFSPLSGADQQAPGMSVMC